MKKNSQPELNARWWLSGAPKGLSTGDDLAKALGSYERARAAFDKAPDKPRLEACLTALAQIDAVASKVVGEIEKLLKRPPITTVFDATDSRNTVEALKRLPVVIAAERKAVIKQGESPEPVAEKADTEADDDAAFGNAEAYKAYLLIVLKKLKSQPLNFAVGLGKKSEDHRLLCHRSRNGKALAALIKRKTRLEVITWGQAWAHPEKNNTIVLSLEGRQPGRLKARVEQLLKVFKPLPFSFVVLMRDGQELEDLDLEDPPLEHRDLPDPEPLPLTSGADARVAALRQEARAALQDAGDTADPAMFVKRLETVRIKADLLADIHGGRAAATELVAQAFALARSRQGLAGFDASTYPALDILADRAFKFRVLKGGLKGGADGRALLAQAVDLIQQGNPAAALDALMAAYQEAAKSRDNALVLDCARLFYELGQADGNAELLFRAAILAGRLDPEAALGMTVKAATVAIEKGQSNIALRSAENLLRLGAPVSDVIELTLRSAEIAAAQNKIPDLIAAATLLLDVPSPPVDRVFDIVRRAASMADTSEDPEASLAMARLQARMTSHDPKLTAAAADYAMRAAQLAEAAEDWQAMVNAAQCLMEVAPGDDAMVIAAAAGQRALKTNQANVTLDAIRFLSSFDVGQSPELRSAITDLAIGVTEAAADQVDVQLDLAATVLDVGGQDTTRLAAKIAESAAQNVKREFDSGDTKAGIYRSMAGALIYDAATRLVASPETTEEACRLACAAGEIACEQSDSVQALKVANFLSKAGATKEAEQIAKMVGSIEWELGNLAKTVGDGDALCDSIQRLGQIAALSKTNATAVQKQIGAWAEAMLSWADAEDLDTCQQLCAILRETGLDPGVVEKKIAEKSLEQAEKDAANEQYGEMITHLEIALQNNPATCELITGLLDRLFSVLDGADIYDEDAILDVGYLQIEIFTLTKDPSLLDKAAQVAESVGKKAEKDGLHGIAQRAKDLYDSAFALTKPTVVQSAPDDTSTFIAVEDLSDFNYQKQTSKAKKYKYATVLHYTSVGGMTTKQQEEVETFAETVTRSTNTAHEELVRGAFGEWDEDGSHLLQMLNLQTDWHKVEKDKAAFYDLQKVRTLQSGKQLEKNKYNEEIAEAAAKAGWPNDFKEDEYLTLRALAHQEKRRRIYAESRSLKMLHRVAGYLIEERTYQLLPSRDQVPWTDQDTSILGGGTRPDITLPLKDSASKFALLDITASDSQGHIFDKRPEWTKSQKVADSIEVLYNSLDHGTLLDVMLEKQSLGAEEVARRQAALQSRHERARAERDAAEKRVRATLDGLGGPEFRQLVGGMTPAKHLLKLFGIKRKGFPDVKNLNKETALLALQVVEAYVVKMKEATVP
ncbi:MAG: hypothetical protein P4M00_23965 [Azospirillaceae bacterium]|nr:hypothetical protein [Azospirillaceae bacterium]